MTRQTLTVTATLAADGSAVRYLPAPRPHTQWDIMRISSTTTETAGSAELRVYRNTVSPATFLLGTDYARSDTADGDPPIPIRAGEEVVIVWNAGAPGATATVAVDVELS